MAIDVGVGHFVGSAVSVDDSVGLTARIVMHNFTLEKCAIKCFVDDGTSSERRNERCAAAGSRAVDDVFRINPGFMKVFAGFRARRWCWPPWRSDRWIGRCDRAALWRGCCTRCVRRVRLVLCDILWHPWRSYRRPGTGVRGHPCNVDGGQRHGCGIRCRRMRLAMWGDRGGCGLRVGRVRSRPWKEHREELCKHRL